MSESSELEKQAERLIALLDVSDYRSSPLIRPGLVRQLRGKLDELYPAQQPASQDEAPLSERIKAIYPVIHRTYEMFDRTKQIDKNVDTFQVGEKTATLEVLDSRYSNAYADCGVMVRMILDGENLYHISRLHPSWKRKNLEYDNYEVKKRSFWEWKSPPDKCVTIRSSYFKIDCMPPEEFVKALCAGSSKPELRQSTLDHLLSLPEILGPYLDKKKKGDLG